MRYQRRAFGIWLGIAECALTIAGLRVAVAGEIWNCKLNGHAVYCDYDAANKLPLRQQQTDSIINLSKSNGCNTTDLEITGESNSNSNTLTTDSTSVKQEYTCSIISENTTKVRRVAETAYSHYSLNCREAPARGAARLLKE